MTIMPNETHDNTDYKFILNVLTEIKHLNYMFQAIKQKCYNTNIISFCRIINEPASLEIYEPIIE